MTFPEVDVMQFVTQVAGQLKIPQKVQSLRYRQDYQDYQAILDQEWHCEFREKIVELAMKEKDQDARREIEFRLKHPMKFEEWER